MNGFPLIALQEQGLSPKASWIKQAKNTIAKGLRICNGSPFQVMTATGPKIVLPNHFAEELKSHPSLSFTGAFKRDFFSDYPGFEGFKHTLDDGKFLHELVLAKLTQSLGLVMKDLAEETTQAVHDIFGEDAEWHETLLKQNILHLVARLSSRVFLGRPLCRNERWLEIAEGYTVDAFIATRALKALPSLVRPWAHWLLPSCIRLRKARRDAGRLIMPEVEARKSRAQKALEAGLKPPKTADAIAWMYEIAREKREGKSYVDI